MELEVAGAMTETEIDEMLSHVPSSSGFDKKVLKDVKLTREQQLKMIEGLLYDQVAGFGTSSMNTNLATASTGSLQTKPPYKDDEWLSLGAPIIERNKWDLWLDRRDPVSVLERSKRTALEQLTVDGAKGKELNVTMIPTFEWL